MVVFNLGLGPHSPNGGGRIYVPTTVGPFLANEQAHVTGNFRAAPENRPKRNSLITFCIKGTCSIEFLDY